MSKKNKWKPYTKAIESGIWWDHEKQAHDWDGFMDAFIADMAHAEGQEARIRVMKDYGIWFGPQR